MAGLPAAEANEVTKALQELFATGVVSSPTGLTDALVSISKGTTEEGVSQILGKRKRWINGKYSSIQTL